LTERIYNVLFLCTGNSARSILAEALLQRWGQGKFQAFSAGSYPTGTVNPRALGLLQRTGIALANPRSKSWDEFAMPGAPQMDFIFTVCDNAAGETYPVWPGHPMAAHWGVPDPAACEGSSAEKDTAFWSAFRTLEARIKLLACLPLAKLEGTALRETWRWRCSRTPAPRSRSSRC
jgi:arsenate reductase (thioredoxin)